MEASGRERQKYHLPPRDGSLIPFENKLHLLNPEANLEAPKVVTSLVSLHCLMRMLQAVSKKYIIRIDFRSTHFLATSRLIQISPVRENHGRGDRRHTIFVHFFCAIPRAFDTARFPSLWTDVTSKNILSIPLCLHHLTYHQWYI